MVGLCPLFKGWSMWLRKSKRVIHGCRGIWKSGSSERKMYFVIVVAKTYKKQSYEIYHLRLAQQ